MVSDLKEGGTFLLNCPWTRRGYDETCSGDDEAAMLAKKHIKFYTIDAIDLGREGRHGQPHQHHHAGRVLQDWPTSSPTSRLTST